MKTFIVIAASFIMLSIAGQIVFGDSNKIQESQYCEMVKLNKATGGEYGWPDYNRTFESECGE